MAAMSLIVVRFFAFDLDGAMVSPRAYVNWNINQFIMHAHAGFGVRVHRMGADGAPPRRCGRSRAGVCRRWRCGNAGRRAALVPGEPTSGRGRTGCTLQAKLAHKSVLRREKLAHKSVTNAENSLIKV